MDKVLAKDGQSPGERWTKSWRKTGLTVLAKQKILYLFVAPTRTVFALVFTNALWLVYVAK
jgi:hypothetical protein